MENTTEQNIILLRDLLKKGINYEDIQDFKQSIFRTVYKRALEALRYILNENDEKMHDEKYLYAEKRKREISNVISFIGRRGTGKSSSMLSFMEALSHHGNSRHLFDIFDPTDQKFDAKDYEQFYFFTLDCIDAGALEATESVFTLVLANLLSKILEYDKNNSRDIDVYFRRTIMQNLEDIYKDYNSLKNPNSANQNEYSAYENLTNAASSQKIRTKFQNLVDNCLQYMSEQERIQSKKTFLVIAVDDLDLAHYNERISANRRNNIRSYEIMRDISKYFSVPNVIVLAAYNHINLQQQCSNFFIHSNFGHYEQKTNTEDAIRWGETLAGEFMEKTFAPVYRIYMPSWKKWDYFGQKLMVDIGTNASSEDLFHFYRKEGKTQFSIKNFLLILYAERMGIYYDCLGKKRHFLEADSLRSLNSILYLLIGEDVLKFHAQSPLCIEKEQDLGNAFKRLMDDVYFRFVQERLCKDNEKKLFSDLLERQIDIRSEEIVILMTPKIEPLGRIKQLKENKRNVYSQTGNGWQVKIRDHTYSYSYAELVHCIYHMTREDIYSKEFVACLLHSYSICLNQLYRKFQKGKELFLGQDRQKEYIAYYRSMDENTILPDDVNLKEIEENSLILEGVIGDTVLGKWTEYFMPKLYYGSIDRRNAVSIATASDIRNAGFKLVCKIENEETDIIQMLHQCIYLMLMYSDMPYWKKLSINLNTSRTNTERIQQVEISYDGDVNFELMAFVKYSILYTRFFSRIEYLLMNAFYPNEADVIHEKLFKTKVSEKIEETMTTLWDSYCAWDKHYGNMLLPIHHFDLMYNMIKNLFDKEKFYHSNSKYCRDDIDFIFVFDELLDFIVKYLKKIDEFYCLKDRKSFVNKFLNCPYLLNWNDLKNNVAFTKAIGNHLRMVTYAVYTNLNMNMPADDKTADELFQSTNRRQLND